MSCHVMLHRIASHGVASCYVVAMELTIMALNAVQIAGSVSERVSIEAGLSMMTCTPASSVLQGCHQPMNIDG